MTQTLSVRMDSEVKKEFISWCNAVGLNASTAMNLFVKNVLKNRKLPFEVGDEDPFYSEANMAFLEEAIKGIEEGKVVVKTMKELEAMANE